MRHTLDFYVQNFWFSGEKRNGHIGQRQAYRLHICFTTLPGLASRQDETETTHTQKGRRVWEAAFAGRWNFMRDCLGGCAVPVVSLSPYPLIASLVVKQSGHCFAVSLFGVSDRATEPVSSSCCISRGFLYRHR
jgi:hypothetical protein